MNPSKKRMLLLLFICLAMLVPASVTAKSPYQAYVYDSLKNTPVSINGYLYEETIDGYDLSSGPFKDPEDIFIADDDTFYIADSGNNRIVHMGRNSKVLGIVGDEEGQGKLNAPKGVFVNKSGDIYVADTSNRRIAVFSKEGVFLKEFIKPDTPLLGEDFLFSPSKLVIDKRGYLFVVSEGAHQGLLQIKPDGKFAGFFGANHVGFSWSRLILKWIATKEQKDQLASVRPPEFSNLFQDTEGFLYTTTLGIRTNQVKRLSAVGVDILNSSGSNRYGDLYMQRVNWDPDFEAFVDVTVDDKGIITALDQTTGRAFQYDEQGNLLFIFGGLGDQKGLFKTPSSIDQTSDGTIYIVDKTRNTINLFHITPFGAKVHEASKLFNEGLYQEAAEPWHEVLDMNANYDLAYKAIGKALYKSEHYYESMAYFKAGRSKADYSLALLEYRKEFLREHFELIFILVLVSMFLMRRWLRSYKKRRKARASYSTMTTKGGG